MNVDEEGNKCPICLEDLLFTCSTIGTISPCGHVFHQICFDSWTKAKKKSKVECPTCLTKCNGFVRLYLSLLKPEEDDDDDDDDDECINDDDYDYNENRTNHHSCKEEEEGDHVLPVGVNKVKHNNPQRLRHKIKHLKKDLTLLQNVRNENKNLQVQCDSLTADLKKIQDDVKRYQEREICYEQDKVQKHVEFIKKDRQIQQMSKQVTNLERNLDQAMKIVSQYKQNKEKENSKFFYFLGERRKK